MHILFISLALLFQPTPPDTIEVHSAVESATVFLSGAEVQRSAEVTLAPGVNHFKFVGLSPGLDDETIQVQSDDKIVLESLTSYRDENHKGDKTDQLNALQDEKEALQDSIKQTNAELTVLDRTLNVLLNNQDVSGASAKISATELQQAITYFEQEFQQIERGRLALQATLERLNQQLQQISRQISDIENELLGSSQVIEMVVNAEEAQTVSFNISYFLSSARWYPSYNIRVPEAGEPLTLTYQANIRQSLGVDWQNVTLAVSSAQPQRETNIPSVDPIYLQLYEEPKQRARLSSDMVYNNLKTAGDRGISRVTGVVRGPDGDPIPSANVLVPETQQGAATDRNGQFSINVDPEAKILRVSFVGYHTKTVPVSSGNLNIVLEPADDGLNEVVVSSYGEPVQTQMREGQTAFRFDIENPYTIESGAAAKTVAVESSTLPARYTYKVIPRIKPAAYLTARITDWESLNLLPGQASLFLNNSYVGDTQLNLNSLRDTLAFSLGRDDGIIIERSQIESFEEKNFFGNRVTETKGWEITVRNTKSRPVAIEVLDQIPISTNEDIDVELTEDSGATLVESTGVLKWTLNLRPDTSGEIRFVYEITYPAGEQLQQNN